MFGISFAELSIIFLLVLLVMGPEKLPEVARWTGKTLRDLRQASNSLRNALMLDDFDNIRSNTKKITDDALRGPTAKSTQHKTSPKTSSGNQSLKKNEHPNYDKPDPGSAPIANSGSRDMAPPTGIDQIDDNDFQQLLESRYRIERTELHHVTLPRVVDTDELIAVELPPRASVGDTVDVPLPAQPVAEVAS